MHFQQLAADQAASFEIVAYRTAVSNLSLQDVLNESVSLLCNVSLGKRWPLENNGSRSLRKQLRYNF